MPLSFLDGPLEFLTDLLSGRDDDETPSEDLRTARTALMIAVIDADDRVTDEERQALSRIVAETFDLDAGAADEMIANARRAKDDATDLYGHTSALRRNLKPSERAALVTGLYELAFADGEFHVAEDAAVKRISDLLGVDPRDRVEARRDVAARHGLPPIAISGD